MDDRTRLRTTKLVPVDIQVGVTDGDYMAILQQILLPIAYEVRKRIAFQIENVVLNYVTSCT